LISRLVLTDSSVRRRSGRTGRSKADALAARTLRGNANRGFLEAAPRVGDNVLYPVASLPTQKLIGNWRPAERVLAGVAAGEIVENDQRPADVGQLGEICTLGDCVKPSRGEIHGVGPLSR
jgi:hypothetical protein